MLSIGDIQVYVTDFDRALRFWAEGLGLQVAEKEVTSHGAFARLDFPDGGPSIHLLAPAEPWEPGTRPEPGARPGIGFDITTSEFDELLVRLIEFGGRQVAQIESYDDVRFVTIADPDDNTFDLLELPREEEGNG
jgi:catechol 2,3-dioxygenase-like lactoylglutathione lyase family enzyme